MHSGTSHVPRSDSAVLPQRLERTPYASKPNVATQRRGNLRYHTKFTFLLRYSASCLSRQFEKTIVFRDLSRTARGAQGATGRCPYRAEIRATLQAVHPGAGACSDSSRGFVSRPATYTSPKPLQALFPLQSLRVVPSLFPLSLSDGDIAFFLAEPRGSNTQPRTAVRKNRAAAKLGGHIDA